MRVGPNMELQSAVILAWLKSHHELASGGHLLEVVQAQLPANVECAREVLHAKALFEGSEPLADRGLELVGSAPVLGLPIHHALGFSLGSSCLDARDPNEGI